MVFDTWWVWPTNGARLRMWSVGACACARVCFVMAAKVRCRWTSAFVARVRLSRDGGGVGLFGGWRGQFRRVRQFLK